MRTTAPSVDILVLVLLLLKIIATVFPDSDPSRFSGIEPDLIVRLFRPALRTSVVNSEGVRSAMERRWRGANGETGGTLSDWVTYRRRLLL